VKKIATRKEELNTVVCDEELSIFGEIHFLYLQGRRENFVSNMDRI
jgi:hypothetical protein